MVAAGQSPNWEWAKSAGGMAGEEGTGIAIDLAGNSYITGYFYSPSISFGSITLNNANSSGTSFDIFTAKYDVSGNLLWAKGAGGVQHENTLAIGVDGNGNSYVTGSFQSDTLIFGNDTLFNAGGGNKYDFFIVKYDAAGNVQWAKRAGGTDFDEGYGITFDADDNPIVTGDFVSSSITLGTANLVNAGGADYFIVKYSSSGNVIWAKSAGGPGYDYSVGIESDPTGNLYITGIFSDSMTIGNIVLKTAGYGDMFLAKYDSSGNALWANSAGGKYSDEGKSIAVDLDGNSFISGEFKSDTITFSGFNFFRVDTAAAEDVFIAKYDSSGAFQWANIVGTLDNDDGNGTAVDMNGNVYVACSFSDDSVYMNGALINGTAGDISILKYNAAGSLIWLSSTGGNYLDEGNAVKVAADGSIYVTGFFNSTAVTFSGTTLTNTSVQLDVFISKTNSTTGLAEQNNSFHQITVFPNPGSGEIKIISAEIIDEVEIRNMPGQIIYHAKPETKNAAVKLDDAGIYFVSLNLGKERVTRKIVVQ